MGIKSAFLNIYDKHYKKLLVCSFLLLFFSIGFIVYTKMHTGEFIPKGVSLKGGLTMTIPVTDIDINKLQSALTLSYPLADIGVRGISESGQLSAVIIEASEVTEDQLVSALKNQGLAMEPGTFSVESMGSSLGESFYKQTIIAVIIAFVFMAIVVFATFRNTVPSMFVILCAISDITSTVAMIDVLGMKLSTAGVAALLMLIGYSVDTDILLTTKVLKQKEGTIFHRTVNTMKTGLLMSLTSFAAALVGYIVTQSDVIKQIMLIIAIGVIFDIIYTWIQNAGILRWYLENKQKKEEQQHGQS